MFKKIIISCILVAASISNAHNSKSHKSSRDPVSLVEKCLRAKQSNWSSDDLTDLGCEKKSYFCNLYFTVERDLRSLGGEIVQTPGNRSELINAYSTEEAEYHFRSEIVDKYINGINVSFSRGVTVRMINTEYHCNVAR